MAPEREFDADDPMELVVEAVDGDLDVMAECLVEEYVRMGTSDEDLMRIFEHPFFGAAHAIYRTRGAASVAALIARVRARWGRPRFVVHEAPARLDITAPRAKED